MRQKRFQKGSLQTRKHGKDRMWVAFWYEDGERRCRTIGRNSQMSKAEAEVVLSSILRDINSGTSKTTKPVYTFKEVWGGRVLAILPSQLEGINCGHIGADHQFASCSRVREEPASRDSEGRPARLSRPESGGYVSQCGGISKVVSKRHLQACHVRWAHPQQPGSGV